MHNTPSISNNITYLLEKRMLKEDIEKDFPFISVVEYGGKEYVGVINNQDHAITSMYIYQDLKGDSKEFDEDLVKAIKDWQSHLFRFNNILNGPRYSKEQKLKLK